MTNEEIRTLITDVTADKSYNACLPDELYAYVRACVPEELIDDEEAFSKLFFTTLEKMCNDKELGRSGRGNIVSGAQLGYLHGTFRANAKGFGFLIPDARFSSLYPEDLFVPAEQTGGAMNGDAVFVRVERPGGGKSAKANKGKK
ncbi:MAG: hypothetical protein J6S76_07210, partial [Clostridia bacterium]|nr:hypothetical protein [Clostridia bacterium]